MEPLTFWYSLVLTLLVTPLIIKFLIKHNTHKSGKLTLPPGPKPWPIVGSLPEMIANRPTLKWIQKVMSELNTEIACIRLGNVHVILVSSPEIAREILKKQDFVFASRPITWSTEYLTGGYLSAALTPYGEQWMKMKKIIINELVSTVRYKWLQGKRVEEADNLVRFVYNQCLKGGGKGLVDVRVATQHYAANIIRRLFLNLRYFGKGSGDGGPGLEEVEYVDSLFTMLQYLYAFSVTDFVPCLRGYNLDGRERIVKNAYKTAKKYHDPIIENRIQEWKNGKKTDKEDLLDILISLKDADNNALLTEQEIKSIILDLTLAAVDNPSNVVEWGLAEMMNQPGLIRKAIEELDNVVGTRRLVQESDIPKLDYVKACAREAFRLHPINDFNLPHMSMEDTVVGNYYIPKGSHVVLRRQGLGTNPRIWTEPLEFKPERHLNKTNGSNLDLGYPTLNAITFSTGRRRCPGLILGTSMTLMLFARMLHAFTWSVPPGHSSIDLSESYGGTTKAKPLVALAEPRLPPYVYHLN